MSDEAQDASVVTMNIPLDTPIPHKKFLKDDITEQCFCEVGVNHGEVIKQLKSNAGRPCEFCRDKEAILKKTQEYIDSGSGDKPKILFLIELALKLGKHRETIQEWAHKKMDDGSLEHPQFTDMVKSVEQMQELRLQQRILGRYNPTGAIFLLKTKHGYIETEKQIMAGDKNEPLEIIFTKETKETYDE